MGVDDGNGYVTVGEPSFADYLDSSSGSPSKSGIQALQEEKLREELIIYLGDRCCRAIRPAQNWKFREIKETKSLVGRLETFVEIRRTLRLRERHKGLKIENFSSFKGNGAPDIWDIPAEKEAPKTFENREMTFKVPNSETLEDCEECKGKGGVPCGACLGGTKGGICKGCGGLGQILNKGEPTRCPLCEGSGQKLCPICSSVKQVPCPFCGGEGSLLSRDYVVISWINIVSEKVNHADTLTSIPDEKIFRLPGKEVHNEEDDILSPFYDPERSKIKDLSTELFDSREKKMPSNSRIVRERHVIKEVPVIKCVLEEKDKSFLFYVAGTRRAVYLENYPGRCAPLFCDCFSCFFGNKFV